MSDVVIRAENLGKKYTIGHQTENGRYTALRDVLVQNARSIWHKTRDLMQGKPIIQGDSLEEVWALKDVNFEIRQGEAVGIIGRNGAGKSTLLKILSRITEPSAGRVTIKGRVASLLEVGTGFHPELTGRENIYLNGAILGMTRAEIKRKFDEIVDFAGVEQFLDTPVKRYSSGMYVRLAFAVAAHLEPEVLVVDEVLAVGDAAFQKKCLGKMGDVAHAGRTVLFVSHNMDAILEMCMRCILMVDGCVAVDSTPLETIQAYNHLLRDGTDNMSAPHVIYQQASPVETTDHYSILSVALLDTNGLPKPVVNTWDEVKFRITYYSPMKILHGSIVIDICDYKGQRLIVMDSGSKIELESGVHHIDCTLHQVPLAAGDYFVSIGLAISRHQWLKRIMQAGIFKVHGKDVFALNRPPRVDRMLFAAPHTWSHSQGTSSF